MTSTAATTQVNARIDRTLKATGDAALLAAGITPSEAIRAIWELAVRFKDEPHSLRDALFPANAADLDEAARKRAVALEQARSGRAFVDAARRELNIPAHVSASVATTSDSELYAEALYERYGDRWSL